MRECRVPLIVFIIEILQSGANSKARSNQGPHREPQSNYPLAKQWTSVVATHSRKPLSGAGAPACNPPTRCRHQNHCTQQMLQAKQTLGLLRERTTTENDERAGNGRRHQQRHLLCYGFGKGEGASNWRRLRLAHERSPAITTCKLCKHREQHAPCTLTRALAKLLMYRAIPRAKRYTDQYL